MNNEEILSKISKCKDVDEVIKVGKENGKDLKREQAQRFFNMAHGSNELNDEELNEVSGGFCQGEEFYKVEGFESPNEVQWVRNVNDVVEIFARGFSDKSGISTYTAKITELLVEQGEGIFSKTYYDKYKIQKLGSSEVRVVGRNKIQKN